MRGSKRHLVDVEFMILTAVVVSIVVGVIVLRNFNLGTTASAAGSADNSRTLSEVSTVTPTTNAPFPGVPAIRPSLTIAIPGKPSFTEADLRDYIARAYPGSEIVEIQYLSGDEVSAQFKTTPLGSRLVSLVTLHGEFSTDIPSNPPRTIVGTTMHVVFDATTGNELQDIY